jgi:Ran GTPase-activating protein (RanGAP) involved in mRNA processing and transport
LKNRRFELVKHGLGPAASRVISDILKRNPHFANLILSNNALGDEGVLSLGSCLKNNTALVSLDLSNNDISPVGGKALFTVMAKHESIISLNVSSQDGLKRNRLGELASIAISHCLSQNVLLQILNISGTSLGPTGLANLCKGLRNNQSLFTLNVSSNETGWKYLDEFLQTI